jgi:predicted transcriptional regulator
MNNLSVEMDNFKIEERRRKVRSLLAEGNTEVNIAKLLGVGQATISRYYSIKRVHVITSMI